MVQLMKKVLIVEDDVIIQKLIEYRLIALGYDVCAKAETGEDAIYCAINMHPDIILMDVGLKGTVDGIDAAKIIRKSLPPSIIFLTAFSDERTLKRAKEVNPDGYINKPFNDTDLRVALTLAHDNSGVPSPA
jgi:CheY-like chemotaxis protein